MIITLTPNPSLDRTVTLDGELVRGGVNRLATVTVEPGGKGLNVARVLVSSGEPVTTVLPADEHDPLLRVLEAVSSPELTTVAVPVRGAARINTAVTEPDGTTTKLNEPGAGLSDSEVCAVEEALVAAAGTADGARGRGEKERNIAITEAGIQRCEDILKMPGLFSDAAKSELAQISAHNFKF